MTRPPPGWDRAGQCVCGTWFGSVYRRWNEIGLLAVIAVPAFVGGVSGWDARDRSLLARPCPL